MGARPGPSQLARSWKPFRIEHSLWHLSIVLWIINICIGCLLWAEESFEDSEFLMENRPMQDQPCQLSMHSHTCKVSMDLFKLKSLPHSCGRQADRFPAYVREQGTFYIVFQKIIQNLTASHHLCSSTLSSPSASFSCITSTASEQSLSSQFLPP